MSTNTIVAIVLITIGFILGVYGIRVSWEVAVHRFAKQTVTNVMFIISGALFFIVGITFFVSNIGSLLKILFLHVMTLL